MEASEGQVEQDIRGVKPVSIVSCSYKLVQCERRPIVVSGVSRQSPPRRPEAFKTAPIGTRLPVSCGRTADLHNSYAGYGKGVGGRGALATKARDLTCEALCSR